MVTDEPLVCVSRFACLVALHNLFLLSILKTTYAAFAPKKSARMHSRSRMYILNFFATYFLLEALTECLAVMPRPAPYRRRQAMEPSHFARENAETAALHKRMMKVANASGIVSIQPDVVQLMLNALERHMIRVISGVQPDVTRYEYALLPLGTGLRKTNTKVPLDNPRRTPTLEMRTTTS
jgi:hypothetical protein